MTASTAYGIGQSILFVALGAAVFLGNGVPLFAPTGLPRTAGIVLAIAGLLLMGSAFPSISEAVQIAPAPKPGARLVTRGIYRWLRHPMYTGILMISIGIFLTTPTVLVGAVAAAIIVFLALKVRFEEKLLAAAYRDYASYKRRTRGLFPIFRG